MRARCLVILLFAAVLVHGDGNYSVASKWVTVTGMSCADTRPSGNSSALVFYPQDTTRKYAVLGFAHGVLSSSLDIDYHGTMRGVASHGHIVIGMKSCTVALEEWKDQVRVIEYALYEDQELSKLIDYTAPTGVFGHSMGGAATINSASTESAIQRIRLGAAAAMHPGIQLGRLSPRIPTLYLTGSIDPLCGPLLTHPQFLLAAKYNVSRGYVVMKNYDHLRVMGRRTNGEVEPIANWFGCYLLEDPTCCHSIWSDKTGCPKTIPSEGVVASCEMKRGHTEQ